MRSTALSPRACGTGACAIKDGLNHAAAIWNPEGDMGDIEIWEMAEPLLYLGRNVKTNSGGYGKYPRRLRIRDPAHGLEGAGLDHVLHGQWLHEQ